MMIERNQGWIQLLFLLVTVSMLFPFYIGSAVMVVAIVVLLVSQRFVFEKVSLNMRAFLFFIVYCLIVASLNRNMIGFYVGLALGLFGVYFAYYRYYITARTYVALLNSVSIGSIGLSILVYYRYASFVISRGESLLYIFQTSNPQFRAEATLFNANYFGLFGIFCFLISLYLISTTRVWRLRLLYGLSMVLMMGALLLTASRMVLPTLVCAVIAWALMTNPRLVYYLIGVAIVGTIILIAKPTLMPRLETLTYGFQDRFSIWNTAWHIFLMNPLTGRGAMSFMNYYYLFMEKGNMHSHQLLIDILANYGLIGLFLISNMLIEPVREWVALYTRRQTRYEVGLIISLVVAVLVHGLMDVSILWVQTGYVWLVVVTCPINVLQQVANYRETRD